MKEAGWRVRGCEPDRDHAEAGAEHFGIQIDPVLYTFADYGTEEFDLVSLCHVLEHCANPRDVVRRMRRDVKHGGHVYIEVPCIERPYRGNLDVFFWEEHVSYFSKETLSAILVQEGFTPERSGYIGNFLWVVAKKTSGLSREVAYPCNDFRYVKYSTLYQHSQFLRRRSAAEIKELKTERGELKRELAKEKSRARREVAALKLELKKAKNPTLDERLRWMPTPLRTPSVRVLRKLTGKLRSS
jgi:SAM-dependent methyltransferase